jgi:hypothetical protein
VNNTLSPTQIGAYCLNIYIYIYIYICCFVFHFFFFFSIFLQLGHRSNARLVAAFPFFFSPFSHLLPPWQARVLSEESLSAPLPSPRPFPNLFSKDPHHTNTIPFLPPPRNNVALVFLITKQCAFKANSFCVSKLAYLVGLLLVREEIYIISIYSIHCKR